jgi:hypothetical protein
MIHDNAHAARLQARYEGDRHWCDLPTSPTFLTLAALAGLLKHFTGSDDGINDDLVEAARECIGEETRADGGGDVRDLIAAWDYSATPEAAVTYLQSRLAPSRPVNMSGSAGDVMGKLA